MLLDELQDLIATGRLSTRVCTTSYGHVPPASVVEETDWDWLPTSRDQIDPIHPEMSADRDAEMAAAKATLVSLRSVSESVASLVDGPHDFNEAARGGAQFAARMAAREITNGVVGLWCDVVRLFSQGWWPCGLTVDERLVIY